MPGTVRVAGQAARAGAELLAYAGWQVLVTAGHFAAEMGSASVGAGSRLLVTGTAFGSRVGVCGVAAGAVRGGCREGQAGAGVAGTAILLQVQRMIER